MTATAHSRVAARSADAVRPSSADAAPLVMHVVYSFRVGGLENGICNLINRLPKDEFRHSIVALTTCDEAFRRRIERDDVEVISLGKPPGQGWRIFPKVWRLFRDRRPAIVHTRNLAALEMQCPAWAAGVPVRIHGEHGRDAYDPDGTSRKYQLVRRAYAPFVTHFVTVSADLERYLTDAVKISPSRIRQIYNGVDEVKFRPAAQGVTGRQLRRDEQGPLVVGAVGRLQDIKGQDVLIEAVRVLIEQNPEAAGRFRLRLIGDGPLRPVLEAAVAAHGLGEVVELWGERDDVAFLMRDLDVYVLPSLGEGISNTVLEAMASGLPVIATRVGGNVELISHEETGLLVPAADPRALAAALSRYLESGDLRQRHGANARAAVEKRFALSAMVDRYRSLYCDALRGGPERRLATLD